LYENPLRSVALFLIVDFIGAYAVLHISKNAPILGILRETPSCPQDSRPP